MSLPELFRLEEAVKKIVRRTREEGKLNTLTPRIIRQEVEKIFSLDDGALNTKEYKITFKQATSEAMSSDCEIDESNGSQEDKKAKKRKSVEQDEAQNVVKKPKVATKRRSMMAEAPPQKKRTSDNKVYKSAAIVPSSDVEPEEGGDTSMGTQSVTSTHTVKMADSNNAAKVQGVTKAAVVLSKVPIEENIYKSESELSVLMDEPPKRSKKFKSKDKETGKKTKETSRQKQKNPAVALSKDQEALKRLKSLVVACGVRKVWKKEFQGLDTPSQQTKRVKDILTNLGMSGRFSLEQARSIKEKRELAQELEDVQSFEKTVVSGQASSRSKERQTREESVSDDDGGDDSVKEEVQTKRKSTARLSIMAFLGDESDED